jgi:acetyl esterase/lipase
MTRSLCCSILLSLTVAQPSHAQSRVIEDIEYSRPDGYSLKLDLYVPDEANSAPRPAVVFVYGGGWKNGSKKSAGRTAAWLADYGFVVAGINYRLTDVAGWPAQINDCYAAVRWVRKNADQYNVDPDNIGAWGTSAGAHLVALMGTREFPDGESTSSRVKAVCDWFGPSDLLTMPPNNVGNGRTEADVANSNGAKLLRATVRDVPKLT